MSDNLTADARAALEAAIRLARQTSYPNVHAAHLLAGLLLEAPVGPLTGVTLPEDVVTELVANALSEGGTAAGEGFLSPSASRVMGLAVQQAMAEGRAQVDAPDILDMLLMDPDDATVALLIAATHAVNAQVDEKVRAAGPVARRRVSTVPSSLTGFVRDLTELAADGHLLGAPGRDDVIDRLLVTLGRRSKNNPVLVGEPGVGKTAVVEELALRFLSGEAGPDWADAHIWELDLGSLTAGTKGRGDFEERVKKLLKEVERSKDPVVLFVDEIHALLRAGSGGGASGAGNLLKPVLARGGVRVLGATTWDEYRTHVLTDAAFERRLAPVEVTEPTTEASLDMIVNKWVPELATHHKVGIDAQAAAAAVRLSHRHVVNRRLPDKAVDVLDEACARVAMTRGTGDDVRVTERDVADVVASMTGVPVAVDFAEEAQHLRGLADRVKVQVTGQDEAVDRLCAAIVRRRSGIDSLARPASFLLAGPTGVGKTHLCATVARELYGPDAVTQGHLIVIDCSELDSPAAVAKLVGAPPGYIGYGDGGRLTEAVRRHRDCVVLLDEIDKADPAIYDLLLQVLDEGRLTDAEGRSVDFGASIVVATSNHGAKEAGRVTGFSDVAATSTAAVRTAIRAAFRPEFLNRLDGVLVFEPLTRDHVSKIAVAEVERLVAWAAEAGITVDVADGVADIVAKAGYDATLGARPLRRAFTDLVTDRVADAVLDGHRHITVTADDRGEIVVRAVVEAEVAGVG